MADTISEEDRGDVHDDLVEKPRVDTLPGPGAGKPKVRSCFARRAEATAAPGETPACRLQEH